MDEECKGDKRMRKELAQILAVDLAKLPGTFRVFLAAREGDVVIVNTFKDAPCLRDYSMQIIGLISTSAVISRTADRKLSLTEEDLTANVLEREAY